MTDCIASVTQLLALTPASGPWRKKLADAAIKWSASNGECPTGDPTLHQYVGELYYKGESSVVGRAVATWVAHTVQTTSTRWPSNTCWLVERGMPPTYWRS